MGKFYFSQWNFVFHDCHVGMVYFLFIALCLMQNPIGCWCSCLRIAELAQEFSDNYTGNGS